MVPVFDNHDELAKVLGQGVRQYRKKRGMKQDDLGQSVGYDDHSNISKIEKGKALPSLDKAFLLARALQVSSVEALVMDPTNEELFMTPITLMALRWDEGCRDDFVSFLRLLADLLETFKKPS